jgi:hypothetical protein
VVSKFSNTHRSSVLEGPLGCRIGRFGPWVAT